MISTPLISIFDILAYIILSNIDIVKFLLKKELKKAEVYYLKKYSSLTVNTPDEKINHIADLVGEGLSLREAQRLLEALQARGFITSRERLLIEIAVRHVAGDSTVVQNRKIADLIKSMLGVIITN